MSSKIQVLQRLEKWIESAMGRHLPCPQIRNYPHFGYVCDYDEQCEGCMIVAAALELKRPDVETTQKSGDYVLVSDMVEGTHPAYGAGLFATRDSVRAGKETKSSTP